MVQSKALFMVYNEISETRLNYAHVVYVIYIISLKCMMASHVRDVTVCILHSPLSCLLGNGGETKFSGELNFKGQGQI